MTETKETRFWHLGRWLVGTLGFWLALTLLWVFVYLPIIGNLDVDLLYPRAIVVFLNASLFLLSVMRLRSTGRFLVPSTAFLVVAVGLIPFVLLFGYALLLGAAGSPSFLLQPRFIAGVLPLTVFTTNFVAAVTVLVARDVGSKMRSGISSGLVSAVYLIPVLYLVLVTNCTINHALS